MYFSFEIYFICLITSWFEIGNGILKKSISSKYSYFKPIFNYIKKGLWKGTLIYQHCDTLMCFHLIPTFSFKHGLLIPHYIDDDFRNILRFKFSNDYIGQKMFVAWAHKIKKFRFFNDIKIIQFKPRVDFIKLYSEYFKLIKNFKSQNAIAC